MEKRFDGASALVTGEATDNQKGGTMPLEYFKWSAIEREDVGRKLLDKLLDDHKAFERKVSWEPGLNVVDAEDSGDTCEYRDNLAQKVGTWLDHFDIPEHLIRPYAVNQVAQRPQSWCMKWDFQGLVDDIVSAMGGSETRIYRPKILEHVAGEVMAWLHKHPTDVDRVHHRTFEVITAEVIKSRGWEVQLTAQTRDGGYDIVGIQQTTLGFPIKVLIECKLANPPKAIGSPMIDKLRGVGVREHADHLMLVTNSRFSRDAWKMWQKGAARNLSLIDRDRLIRWLSEQDG